MIAAEGPVGRSVIQTESQPVKTGFLAKALEYAVDAVGMAEAHPQTVAARFLGEVERA